MTELPPQALHDAPAGTPHAERSRAADVWCSHGVRWTHEPEGYLPVEAGPGHPAIPCVDAGSIPPHCQPITAHDPAKYPTAGPQGVAAAARREQGS